ncbi:MAG: cytochrome c3 family protein [Syntrophales bacterium]
MHVLRPLYVVLTMVAIVLIARTFFVPDDFGIHERGYMYGWYRQANIEDWKAVKVKYQGKTFCAPCHNQETQKNLSSPHRIIECENCHGPAVAHPEDPPKLTIDKTRELCLRCHAHLPYPTSQRSEIKGIDPDQHNTGLACVLCHNPHEASKPR